MLPAFLITFREVIEATLIVATILGILVKLKQPKNIKTVWLASIAACLASVFFLALGSFAGIKVQEFYTGRTEELIEGIFMITSAIFITWAVFWLHRYFGRYKLALLQKVKHTIAEDKPGGLFILVFTAVFREGFEIVLFLSTIYLSSSPQAVFGGFGLGLAAGLIVSLSLFTATLKLPVYRAFQATSVLLVLFAAGLLGRGVHEFIEAGVIPEYTKISLSFIPPSGHVIGDMIKAIFGISQKMDFVQVAAYGGYIAFMRWYLFIRPQQNKLSEK